MSLRGCQIVDEFPKNITFPNITETGSNYACRTYICVDIFLFIQQGSDFNKLYLRCCQIAQFLIVLL